MTRWRMTTPNGHRIHRETLLCERDACKPVVVIDPEDREQVERLDAAIARECGWLGSLNRLEFVQAALRSLIAPPKPDEPQGLGAVVEDAEGTAWVRSHIHSQGAPWTRPYISGTFRWDQITAVRVLSEGVQS